MTTRYEMDLRDIELRRSKPAKGQKVHEAEILHLETQRKREKQRDEMTQKLGKAIKCQWVDTELDEKGNPVKWERACAVVEIGSDSFMHEIQPYKKIDGEQRLDPHIVSSGYRGMVQEWALWKWHTLRGSEVDEVDRYIVDCELPKFEWPSPKTK